MNRGHILALEKCFRVYNLKRLFFLAGAAAIILAAALVSIPPCADAAEFVKIKGLPEWVAPLAQKSLDRVWKEMKNSASLTARTDVLEIVAGRLFDGYSVTSIRTAEDGVVLELTPGSQPGWKVEIIEPSLTYPGNVWFSKDIRGMDSVVLEVIRDIPVEALSWTDVALRERINEITREYIEGWKPSIVVNLPDDLSPVLQLRFAGEEPLVLAFRPEVSSSSIPVILRSELKDSMLKNLYVFNGIPVAWLESHKKELQNYTRDFLAEKDTVSNARARVSVTSHPDQITTVKAEVESSRYSLGAKLVVPIGADERYPELHLHLGRIVQPFTHWDLEIYGEFITSANDLDIESRWGAGWHPWKKLWIGAEYETPEDVLWYRSMYTFNTDGPYLWWRYSEDSINIFGAGWPLNQYFSIEVHYDERYEDSFSVRLVSEL